MRCHCGRCQAVRRSVWGGGYRWVRLARDRWWDTRHATVTHDRWTLQELESDADGRAQCPHCRDLLTAGGHAIREQAQMQLTLS